jgi:hypothetical protein
MSLILAKAKINGFFEDVKDEELDMLQERSTSLFADDSALVPQRGNVELYLDTTGSFAERNAQVTLRRTVLSPVALDPQLHVMSVSRGDNATFKGTVAIAGIARDDSTVTNLNKGVLYGGEFIVQPQVDRNNVPYDDATGVNISNQGSAVATDALYFGRARSDLGSNPTADDWANIIANDAWGLTFIKTTGTHTIGLSFSTATISTAAIRMGNNQVVAWNKADGTLKNCIKVTTGNTLQLAPAGGGIDIRDSFGGIYTNSKLVMQNNTPLYGIQTNGTSESELIKLDSSNDVSIFAGKAKILAGGGQVLTNVGSIPATPTAAGAIYVESGALKYKGSSGTVTTLAPA